MYKNISVESVGTHRDIVTRTQDDIQGLISHILNLKQYMTSRYYVGILLFFFSIRKPYKLRRRRNFNSYNTVLLPPLRAYTIRLIYVYCNVSMTSSW